VVGSCKYSDEPVGSGAMELELFRKCRHILRNKNFQPTLHSQHCEMTISSQYECI
jgi:hypothetical protein